MYPLILKLFPDPATRPRQREVLIEFYRKGKVDEALRAFKKIYLEVVHQIIDHLETGESANSRSLIFALASFVSGLYAPFRLT